MAPSLPSRLVAALVLATLPCAASGPAGWDGEHLAPDGRPGLGVTRSARELGRLFHPSDDAERRMLAGIIGLEGDILVLREESVRAYRAAGYFDLLGAGELDELHGAFPSFRSEVLEHVGRGGEVAARLFLDLRFRLRRGLLDRFEHEAREVRDGLALLRASAEGFVLLKDVEAQRIAGRVDLASALLRALRLDLEALRQTGSTHAPGVPDEGWCEELLLLAAAPDTARTGLADLERRLEERRTRLAAALFFPRAASHSAEACALRAGASDQAVLALPGIRELLPETEEGRTARPEVAALAASHRHARALRLAVEALALDPLNEELCYLAGVAGAFLLDPREVRAWFDRYLALRGIRAGDDRTYRDRALSAEEARALAAVQSVGLGRR
ncbi:MAG: hypothetical protein CMJ84_01795 [Planctomycetes bacterium]|nr:hypothetical protein [Planctomycetota bacterium]